MKIKFKAYVHHLNWLVPVEEINFSQQYVEVDLSGGNGDTSQYGFDEVALAAYTGMADRNGQEIYTGHVVTLEVETTEGFYRTDSFRVKWVDEAAQFGLERDSIVHLELNAYLPYSVIIGNIFENPDLVK